MASADEGYIKFACDWQEEANSNWDGQEPFEALRDCRARLVERAWVGQYVDGPLAGIGFGNLSVRGHAAGSDSDAGSDSVTDAGSRFWITGSATGGVPHFESRHVALVTAFDVGRNAVSCRGEVKASSESMTHAVIYRALPWVQAVVHIHDLDFWRRCLKDPAIARTAADVPYGTPAMAEAMEALAVQTAPGELPVIAMAGHEEGVVAFGATLAEAEQALEQVAMTL